MSLLLVRSMGLASLVHNRFPWKSDSVPVRVSSPSPIRAQIRSLVFFSHRLRSSCSVSCLRRSRSGRIQFTPIACARRTEQDEDISTSEETERTSSESSDVINSNENASNTIPSVGTPGGKIQGPDHDYVSSIRTVALCVCTAVAFGLGVGLVDGVGKASEFFAGYLLEQSLSVDNLFVFVLIFKYFKVPIMYQSRVLSYGIAGAIIFRSSIILLGTATLQKFEAVNLLLAMILLYSSFKLFTGEEEENDLSDNFIVKTCQKFIPVTSDYDGDRFITVQDGLWKATPLLLTVAVIELSDIAFAVDSIPAVFGVTRDPFIVFSSNLFAILGLRSLYVLISESMSELEYLQARLERLDQSPTVHLSNISFLPPPDSVVVTCFYGI
ncbi:thylakoid membrane protein TERC, chloroplastic isoform X2 [Telopea speciosissima]|uniref:thylakoid membrane protein TERC, chloroplastic isoform X2 n=1 Tax=Telopea speciosissima TaxID=54955 RepID=UPI001CC67705|nr:thylakoid membrane protein TERC, chloroplastic isoform X2 [Telopea speciosissima]